MKKNLLAVVCIVCLVFGLWSTALAVDDKTLYDENMAIATNYYSDSFYPSKNQGHLAECKNELQTAKSNLQKHCTLAGCMYFAFLSTGGSLVYIMIKSRKDTQDV